MNIHSYRSNILICTVKYKVCLYVRLAWGVSYSQAWILFEGVWQRRVWGGIYGLGLGLGRYSIIVPSGDPGVHSGPRLVY